MDTIDIGRRGDRPRISRRARRMLAIPALALVGIASSAARVQAPPASGFAYYGDATDGQGWTSKNFVDLTRSDTPAFHNENGGTAAIREGDRIRALHAVAVHDRAWTSVKDPRPATVGYLRRGDVVVIRDVYWIGLQDGFRRSGFWIRYERAPSR